MYNKVLKAIEERYRAPGSSKRKPSFKEFVMYITDPRTRTFNGHWVPFYKCCLPCKVRYDFIGHYETLQQDVKYLTEKIAVGKEQFRSRHRASVGASTIMVKQLATLSHHEIKKLMDIYRLDFLLYGYSTELQSYT